MRVIDQVNQAVEAFYQSKGKIPSRIVMPKDAFETMWAEGFDSQVYSPKVFVCPLTGQVVREEPQTLEKSKEGSRQFNLVTAEGIVPVFPGNVLFMLLED